MPVKPRLKRGIDAPQDIVLSASELLGNERHQHSDCACGEALILGSTVNDIHRALQRRSFAPGQHHNDPEQKAEKYPGQKVDETPPRKPRTNGRAAFRAVREEVLSTVASLRFVQGNSRRGEPPATADRHVLHNR